MKALRKEKQGEEVDPKTQLTAQVKSQGKKQLSFTDPSGLQHVHFAQQANTTSPTTENTASQSHSTKGSIELKQK